MAPEPFARVEDDRYFTLPMLAAYSGLSTKTLRRYMADPERPLPTHYVHVGARDRGRVLISKRAFDAWVQSFPARRAVTTPAPTEMDRRVAAAVRSLRGQ